MANLVARYMFRDLEGLFRQANRPHDAPSLLRLLREHGKQHPDGKTVQLIVYRCKLFKSGLAESMLDAFSRALTSNGTISAPLSLSQSMIEFDSFLPDLGSVLTGRELSVLHPENDPFGELAAAVGIQPDMLREMSRGGNRLVPQEMAMHVAHAAQVVLRLPRPLEVRRVAPNERMLKPLGAENSKKPHECDASTRLRADTIMWCRRSNAGSVRIAAQ